MPRIIATLIAAALLTPAALAVPADATAGPLLESREGGKRQHKRIRKRPERRDRSERPTRRRVRRPPVRRYYSPRYHHDHVWVFGDRYHDYEYDAGYQRGYAAGRYAGVPGQAGVEGYGVATPDDDGLDVSFGADAAISGFDAPQLTDQALPGQQYRLSLGIAGDLLGAEVGAEIAGYRFDPQAGVNDIGLVGLWGDLKLQPDLGIIEPFARVGLGGVSLYDGYLDESTGGFGLRGGVGVELGFDRIGLRAEYLYSHYQFAPLSLTDGDFSAATESVGLGLRFYF